MSEVILDSKEWDRKIRGILSNLKNGNKLLRSAMSIFGFRDIEKHFDDEKGPDGRWAPRAKSTNEMYDAIASGRRRAPSGASPGTFSSGNKILQLTGKMRQSVMPSNVRDNGSNSIVVFSASEYSGKHNTGDPSKSLPKREFLWLSDQAQKLMAQSIVDKVIRDEGNI